MNDYIKTKSENGVYHIVFNRTEKRNALNRAMYAGLAEGIHNAENDPNIRVILLYGNGVSFCAGNDLKDFQDTDIVSRETRPSRNFTEEIMNAKKPLIAAVHGYAIGIGVTMLLHFDLVYCAEKTRLQFPFVNLGLIPEFGSTYRLPQLIGSQRAAELFFFGEWFSAEDALKMGMISKIFPEAELIEKVTSLAETLAEKPPEALRQTKKFIKKHHQENLAKIMPEEGAEFFRRQRSPEAQEAFKAFFERRKPDFSKFA
ncbi:MAG: enoyl-CoA hydratase [Promethearchaeota archaeon]|jgi:enoyl-CoA hydratase/carnithine racemase